MWLLHVVLLSLTLLKAQCQDDCVQDELRCSLLCRLIEMQHQCGLCRNRAPVRFGKRNNPVAVIEHEAGGSGVDDDICCPRLISVLLHSYVE